MKIGKRKIGINEPPLIIAEIGINHGGNIEVAKKLVQSAFRSGCEVIKHQTHFIDDEMTEEAKNIFPPNDKRSIWEIMKVSSISKEEEILLKNFTEELGMIYISTPFSRKAANFLNSINVPAFKIGSGECDNYLLLEHISKFGKPVILSTGMQSLETIKKSVEILEKSNVEYALLECTNLYPSPPENVSLKGITDLKKTFPKTVVGFSDHSIGSEMSLAAVALGASIIERHFTDTRYRAGPDILCSMEPNELRYLIDRSKEIHIALNNPKLRTLEEEEVYKFARSSIVADKTIRKGKLISKEDIWARRPGNGDIPGKDYKKIIGKKINKTKKINEQLSWNDFD